MSSALVFENRGCYNISLVVSCGLFVCTAQQRLGNDQKFLRNCSEVLMAEAREPVS